MNRKKLDKRIDVVAKLEKIIEQAVEGFCEVRANGSKWPVRGYEGVMKARRLLEDSGIDCDNWNDVKMMNSRLFEMARLKMEGKICCDAPDWFRMCDPEQVPPTVLFVPEELALKMLALNFLPA
jgi:hypothetical protein